MNITRNQWLFACKVYLAAMLAYAIVVELGLSNPYWAMVTCCVLSNPLSGALRARSIYRFSGTLVAGVISLILSAWLVSEPFLLLIATGLISSLVFALSFMDRTPRSYSLQLTGVTLMLVLIAYLGQPERMFDMVVTRVTEISIGILSVTLVDALFMPGSVQPMLTKRISGWILDLEKWRDDCLAGIVGQNSEQRQVKMLSDVASLSQLVSTLKYDHEVDQKTKQAVIALQRKIMQIIPILSAIDTSLSSLTQDIRTRLTPALAVLKTTNRTNTVAHIEIPDEVKAQTSPWENLVLNQLELLLNQYTHNWDEIMSINNVINGKQAPLSIRYSIMKAKAFPLPPDLGLVIRIFGSIVFAFAVLCGVWYATGWRQGPNAVLFGVIAISFFGGADEPGAAIANFGLFAFISTLTAFCLEYVLLPMANSYGSFLLNMALFMIPMGLWASKNPMAMLVMGLSLSNVNFQSYYSPYDLGFFLESSTATLMGVYVAFLSIALFRRWGAHHMLEQLLTQEQRDQRKLTSTPDDLSIERYVTRSLDRIAAQAARLGAKAEGQCLILLTHVHATTCLARLRQLTYRNEMNTTAPVHQLLKLLNEAQYIRLDHESDILKHIDMNLRLACEHKETAIQHLLTGLRITLYPQAPQWSSIYVE